MKRTKILRLNDYQKVMNQLSPDIKLFEMREENMATQDSLPLYESKTMSITDKITNAIIVLPSNLDETVVNVESLTRTICLFVKSLNIKKNFAFSIGNYFVGDYTIKESIWDTRSLCVSLYGVISDKGTTISAAVEILNEHKLPSIFIVFETSAIEITKDGTMTTLPF